LPVALGLSDGILNALVLAASAMLHGKGEITLGLAYRVALVALVTAVFTVFVAEYANPRARLRRAERQLNLTRSGRLATTQLGRTVAREALEAAVAACVASFLGAICPLLVGALLPAWPWCSLLFAVAALAVLGAALAKATSGHVHYWSGALAVCGVAVAAVGTQLRIA
jgi:predicted membrane protein (TIGR00267 family)